MASFIEIVCGGCGVVFGMTPEFQKLRRKDHKTFWCPSGCGRVYNGPSEEEKLRKQLETQRQQNAMFADDARAARERADAAERRAAAARGQVTKLKRRAAAGLCPCCNRTFENLARHMAGQHPTFRADEVEEVAEPAPKPSIALPGPTTGKRPYTKTARWHEARLRHKDPTS